MATVRKILADLCGDVADDADDFPRRMADGWAMACEGLPPRSLGGVRLDRREEAALYVDTDAFPEEEAELPDVDGWPDDYDSYDIYQSQMSLWLSGRGPRPE
jgi:hypothetical protein